MDRRSLLLSLMLIPFVNFWFTPPKPREIQLAASGNVREVLTEIAHYVETRNPGVKVKLFFGTSDEVAGQIRNHAAFDVYVGDEDDLSMLESQAMLVENTGVPLICNQLVALAGPEVEWDISDPKALTPDTVKKIAMQKDTTKNGKIMRDYLQKYGVLDALVKNDKIKEVKSPKGAIEALRSGEAKWTLALSTEAVRRKAMTVLWRVDPKDIPPTTYSVAQLVSSKNPDVASKVIAALQSSIARKLFENAGFQVLIPPPVFNK